MNDTGVLIQINKRRSLMALKMLGGGGGGVGVGEGVREGIQAGVRRHFTNTFHNKYYPNVILG